MITFKQFQLQQVSLLKQAPNLFWAKKLDKVAHIPTKDHKVECGKYGALLGNNYAGDHVEVCTKCCEVVYERDYKPISSL